MKIQPLIIEKRFIPEFNGNRDLPPGEQIIIYFKRIPGTSEESTYKSMRYTTNAGVELVYNDKLLLSAFVEKIENLEIGNDKIDSGKKLSEATAPILMPLISEIRDYVFPNDKTISEGEPKP